MTEDTGRVAPDPAGNQDYCLLAVERADLCGIEFGELIDLGLGQAGITEADYGAERHERRDGRYWQAHGSILLASTVRSSASAVGDRSRLVAHSQFGMVCERDPGSTNQETSA